MQRLHGAYYLSRSFTRSHLSSQAVSAVTCRASAFLSTIEKKNTTFRMHPNYELDFASFS
jgi:hypothetical protein